MVGLMLLQSPSVAEKNPLHLCCRGGSRGGTMSHWWIICLLISEWHSGVWIEGLLSCFSIRGGCQEERHKGGLLFGHRAQASCHCTGAWRHISVSSFLPEAWAGPISRDISNGLIVVPNARSIALPVRPWMNQYPGVNRHVSARLTRTFIWHFSMLNLTDSDQPVSNSQQWWEFYSFRKSPQLLHADWYQFQILEIICMWSVTIIQFPEYDGVSLHKVIFVTERV